MALLIDESNKAVVDERAWREMLGYQQEAEVENSSLVDSWLNLGKDAPKCLLGLLAIARPQILSADKLDIHNSEVTNCEIEFVSPIGRLRGQSKRASLLIGENDWVVGFPLISMMIVGGGETLAQAMDDWTKGFERDFALSYRRVAMDATSQADGDWESWCRMFGINELVLPQRSST